MRYYSKEGYIDFDRLLAADRNDFIFMVGARGIGKTFGILKYMIDHDLKFIYMRRTQTQVDMIRSDELNPFNALTSVLGEDYIFVPKTVNKNITAVYRGIYDEESQVYVPAGPVVSYILALSTVANIRGFDASDVDYLIGVAERIRYDSSVLPYFNYSLTGILTLARAVLECAAARRESRGAHYRSDFPAADDAWRCATLIDYDGGAYRVRADKEGAYES